MFCISYVVGCSTALTYLYAEVASVHVVAQEEISCGSRRSANLKELNQIEELAMNIAADGNWGLHIDHILLLAQQIGAVVDDAQGDGLLDAALEQKVLTQYIEVGLARFGIVVNFRHGQLVCGRQGHI